MMAKCAELESEKKGEELERAMFEESRKAARGLLEKTKAIRGRVAATKVPEAIAARKQALLEKLDALTSSCEKSAQMRWEAVKKMKGEAARKRGE